MVNKINLIDFIPIKINDKTISINEIDNKLVIEMNGIGSPKVLTLNKKIKINNFLFEIIGLYSGDGLNTRNHTGNRRVAFANSNYKLHEHWLKFLNCLNINKNQLFAQLSIGKNVDSDSTLNYWLSKTKIPKGRFARISKHKEKSCKEGTLSIEFNSIIFRKIFDNIFNYCINLLPNNKEYIPSFVAGLFAAEGRVALRDKSLNYLGIAIKPNKKREFVKFLLRNVGIKPSRDRDSCEIIINNHINFKIFDDFNIAKIHPDKYALFKKGFNHLSYSVVPALTKIKIIDLLKIRPMTRFQIANKLNKDISIIHKMLKDLEIKRIIKKSGKEKSINKSRDIWSLIKVPKNVFSLMKQDYIKPKP